MFERLDQILERYQELTRLMATQEVAQDHITFRKHSQERADLEEIVTTYRAYLEAAEELEATQEMQEEELDPEMRDLVASEISTLEDRLSQLEDQLRVMLLPQDPRDERSVIVEIRAGTGGDEAGLFAADLFSMYSQYAGAHDWKVGILSSNETGIGGYKEIVFEVKGQGAFSRLKYESGVHRVQRVPTTETSGRIHTSTATVAVLPEADEVEVDINDNDLRVDVFRSGGHGGQSVNTTDSAVRITHEPTGIVVQCQDERSQLQNRARAMSILRARLYDMEYRRQVEELESTRRMQVGTGERSEKIRTYNFPQNRVTDHRIGMTVYQLEDVLSGELDQFIDELISEEQAELLAGVTS